MVAKANPAGFLFSLSSKMHPRLDPWKIKTCNLALFIPVLNTNGMPALFQKQLPGREALDSPGQNTAVFQVKEKGSVPKFGK